MQPQETQEKMSSNNIRKATFDDISEMARISVECWKHNYKGIIAQDVLDDMSVEKNTKKWSENFEEMKKNKVFYVKEIDGKVVGFISGGINDDQSITYDNEITGLYVDINQQGKQIGKMLFEKILEDELFKDCTSFCLRTLKDNLQSNHFYQKMGGKQFGFKSHPRFGTMLVGYYRKKSDNEVLH